MEREGNVSDCMSDCVFCDIVAGTAEVSSFYQDDLVLGLMTLGPVNTGHAMIIPKKHATYLADMDEETGRQLGFCLPSC